jgi:hypothetical protein
MDEYYMISYYTKKIFQLLNPDYKLILRDAYFENTHEYILTFKNDKTGKIINFIIKANNTIEIIF